MSKDINIDINPESIKASLRSFVRSVRRYAVELFAIFVLAIFGFLIWQINNFSNIQPSDEQVLVEEQIIKRPKLDEEAVSKIKQLEAENIAVQSLFEAARDNPFKD